MINKGEKEMEKMEQSLIFAPTQMRLRLECERLKKSCEYAAQFGLRLTDAQITDIVESRHKALADTGRVEFGEGITEKLVYAFCDSTYVNAQNFEQTIVDLQDIFYNFKNEYEGDFSDDELITAMRKYFEECAQGAASLLADADYSTLKLYSTSGSFNFDIQTDPYCSEREEEFDEQ